MRLIAILMMAEVAAQNGQGEQEPIAIYVESSTRVPQEVQIQARALASSMFATIGVKIRWHNGKMPPASSPNHALAIKFVTNTPQTEKPGALAFATPFEGTHIVVFWDRIEFGLDTSKLLAHVMVHEITHVLQGVCRHSETGIMKAHWTEDDHSKMKTHPLNFTAEDVDLIHRGLTARSATLSALTMSASLPRESEK